VIYIILKGYLVEKIKEYVGFGERQVGKLEASWSFKRRLIKNSVSYIIVLVICYKPLV
jgi:hypothetical protein